jgi:hypothetical protein
MSKLETDRNPLSQNSHILSSNEENNINSFSKHSEVKDDATYSNIDFSTHTLFFKSSPNEIAFDTVTIKNTGKTCVYFKWQKNLIPSQIKEIKSDGIDRFFCHYSQNKIFPDEEKKFTFSFFSEKNGMFSEDWVLKTTPPLKNCNLNLHLNGMVHLYVDKYSENINKLNEDINKKSNVTKIHEFVLDLIDDVKENEPELPNMNLEKNFKFYYEFLNKEYNVVFSKGVMKDLINLYYKVYNEIYNFELEENKEENKDENKENEDNNVENNKDNGNNLEKPSPRSGHSLLMVNNSEIYIFGGKIGMFQECNDLWKYDINGNKFILLHDTTLEQFTDEEIEEFKREENNKKKKKGNDFHFITRKEQDDKINPYSKLYSQNKQYNKKLLFKSQSTKEFNKNEFENEIFVNPGYYQMKHSSIFNLDNKDINAAISTLDMLLPYKTGDKGIKIPLPRDGQSLDFYNNQLLVFGGDRNKYPFNDFYIFNISN